MRHIYNQYFIALPRFFFAIAQKTNSKWKKRAAQFAFRFLSLRSKEESSHVKSHRNQFDFKHIHINKVNRNIRFNSYLIIQKCPFSLFPIDMCCYLNLFVALGLSTRNIVARLYLQRFSEVKCKSEPNEEKNTNLVYALRFTANDLMVTDHFESMPFPLFF